MNFRMRCTVPVLFALAGMLFASTADAQTTYWLGRKAGPNDARLIYDIQLPPFFVTWMKMKTATGGSYTRTVNGRQYTFYKQNFAWDNDMARPETGQIAVSTGTELKWQFDRGFSGQGYARLRQELHALSVKASFGNWRDLKPATMVEVQGNQAPNLAVSLKTPSDTGTNPSEQSGNPAKSPELLVTNSPEAPFNTSGSSSEQTGYSAKPPELLVTDVGLNTVVAWNRYSQGKNKDVQLTAYNQKLQKLWQQTLPLDRLAGLTSDGTNIYAMSVKHETGLDNSVTYYRQGIVMISKYNMNGQVVWQKDVNNANYLGDIDKQGLAGRAFYHPMTAGTGCLQYGAGKLLAVLATNTVPDSGGGRHQGSRFFVINASDGSPTRSVAESSWRHSFDQRAIFDGQSFLVMDLADAGWYMPTAGITVRKAIPNNTGAQFSPPHAEGVYIYARQSETAGNQNFTFTSMGDIVPGSNGYGVIFSSERNNNVTQRSGWQVPLAEPRNLAYVHVVKNFETVQDARHTGVQDPQGKPVTGNVHIQWGGAGPNFINITSNIVNSPGQTIQITRPGNNAKRAQQTGVVWLTNYQSGVSVERPSMVRSGNNFIVVWEEWSYQGTGQNLTYKATKTMMINERGGVVMPARAINARLNPGGAGNMIGVNGRALWVTGDGAAGTKSANVIDPNLNHNAIALP